MFGGMGTYVYVHVQIVYVNYICIFTYTYVHMYTCTVAVKNIGVCKLPIKLKALLLYYRSYQNIVMWTDSSRNQNLKSNEACIKHLAVTFQQKVA